jgi:hypothetical protein
LSCATESLRPAAVGEFDHELTQRGEVLVSGDAAVALLKIEKVCLVLGCDVVHVSVLQFRAGLDVSERLVEALSEEAGLLDGQGRRDKATRLPSVEANDDAVVLLRWSAPSRRR